MDERIDYSHKALKEGAQSSTLILIIIETGKRKTIALFPIGQKKFKKDVKQKRSKRKRPSSTLGINARPFFQYTLFFDPYIKEKVLNSYDGCLALFTNTYR